MPSPTLLPLSLTLMLEGAAATTSGDASTLSAVEWVTGAEGECSTLPVIAMEAAGANATDTYPAIQALLVDLGWTVNIVEGEAIDTLAELVD